MHEGVDGFQLAFGWRAVEVDDDAGNGARSKAHAYEVPRQKVEAVWDEVAEGARGSAHTGEDGDLGGPGRHRS